MQSGLEESAVLFEHAALAPAPASKSTSAADYPPCTGLEESVVLFEHPPYTGLEELVVLFEHAALAQRARPRPTTRPAPDSKSP